MSKERLAQIEAAFAEAKSVEKERICLAPYEADIDWLLATARAGLEDRERLDWMQEKKADAFTAWHNAEFQGWGISLPPGYELIGDDSTDLRGAIDDARDDEGSAARSGQASPNGGTDG